MLEVRHFQMVEAIARTGSFTQAAVELHLAQPALSHRQRSLEKCLGAPVFRREAKGMTLTPEGERIASAGEIVLRAVHDAEHDLRLLGRGYQGTLRITTECYTCYHWLPSVLRHFSEKFPDVDVQIVPDASTDPLNALLEKRLDVAIVHSMVDQPALVSEELFEDDLVAVLPLGHPLADRLWLEPSDFEGEVLLLHHDAPNTFVMTGFLRPAGVKLARVTELQLSEALLQTVRSGFGITVMARWAVQPELDRGDLVGIPLGPDGLVRSWRMVTRRDLSRRASVQELAGLLKHGTPLAGDHVGSVSAGREIRLDP